MQSNAVSAPSATVDGLPLLLGRAALGAGVLGVGLGMWCRAFIEGAGGAFGVSLAQLGAPWVLAAFAVGAIVAVHRSDNPAFGRTALALGGLAGAAAMVIASFVYYGNASSTAAVFWAVAGLTIGGAAGLAGAAWRGQPGGMVAVVASGGLGLALIVEGVGRLAFGWFHIAGDMSHLAARVLVVAGVVLPIVLTRGRAGGFAASLCVLLLGVPVAATVVAVSHGLGLA